MRKEIRIKPIGVIRTSLRSRDEAPKQGGEAMVEGKLLVDERYIDGLEGLKPGQRVVILYWLDRAERERLQVHPRSDRSRPLKGVFATRSPHRPNPIAIDEVELMDIQGTTLLVRGLDALDNTPLLDIKCELRQRS
jgi:tRNA-Thr(GGU) m(6)t(6)A37 methyltransferase TsaA